MLKSRNKFTLNNLVALKKIDRTGKKFVCRLNNQIYGSKQAAKNWYGELAKFLIWQNFLRSKNDYYFSSKNEKGKKVFVLSWVHDLVIAGNSLEAIEELKKTLETKFKMDDRGKFECFPGMQINEDSE